MKFKHPIALSELAQLVGCDYQGDPGISITGINEIHRVVPGDVVFVDHPKYYEKALKSAATVVLIDKEVPCPEGKGLILTPNPFHVFNTIAEHFYAKRETVKTRTELQQEYPGVFFGNNVRIGERVKIYPGACILDDTVIGNDVIIGSNTVLGHSAFYYKKNHGEYAPMFNCGYVEIADGVEIGANCTIDRGVTDVTYIGRGTKIDNLVQIENNVTFWGQVGCASGVKIGSGAIVLAQSGISKDLPGNNTYFGSPCGEVREKFKEMAALKQLPSMLNSNK
jgi:UDP-3-O-[3-hydroxymyristoyl] glucosamine N-acyltransferase